MARGPKKHLKRIAAPKHWMLDKMGGIWAPRPNSGPHKLRECLPLILILRNRLKYALNGREVITICMNKLVSIDGKVRTDHKFPCGFMDVVSLKKSNEHFRLMYDTKGRFKLNRINAQSAKTKLCKVTNTFLTTGKVPVLSTHDGRVIRFPDPVIKKNDTIAVDLKTGEVEKLIKFGVGSLVMITKGRNCGRVGVLMNIQKHPGGFDIINVKDEVGNVFATRQENAFVIGEKEGKPEVELPKGKGIKLTIIEEKEQREA
eukprot:augustus_masked-scaffold_7-processed-gene-7.43-mRNA-1 protein AED:0.28 eAED:0.28 QI:0/-1/0/1/-1/1/1/0/258